MLLCNNSDTESDPFKSLLEDGISPDHGPATLSEAFAVAPSRACYLLTRWTPHIAAGPWWLEQIMFSHVLLSILLLSH